MIDLLPPDNEERRAQAFARAEWELGDSSWADIILFAYWNPEEDKKELAEEMGDG